MEEKKTTPEELWKLHSTAIREGTIDSNRIKQIVEHLGPDKEKLDKFVKQLASSLSEQAFLEFKKKVMETYPHSGATPLARNTGLPQSLYYYNRPNYDTNREQFVAFNPDSLKGVSAKIDDEKIQLAIAGKVGLQEIVTMLIFTQVISNFVPYANQCLQEKKITTAEFEILKSIAEDLKLQCRGEKNSTKFEEKVETLRSGIENNKSLTPEQKAAELQKLKAAAEKGKIYREALRGNLAVETENIKQRYKSFVSPEQYAQEEKALQARMQQPPRPASPPESPKTTSPSGSPRTEKPESPLRSFANTVSGLFDTVRGSTPNPSSAYDSFASTPSPGHSPPLSISRASSPQKSSDRDIQNKISAGLETLNNKIAVLEKTLADNPSMPLPSETINALKNALKSLTEAAQLYPQGEFTVKIATAKMNVALLEQRSQTAALPPPVAQTSPSLERLQEIEKMQEKVTNTPLPPPPEIGRPRSPEKTSSPPQVDPHTIMRRAPK